MNAQVHSIESEEQATEALKYFNGFHDGFLKRIELESQDSFQQDGPEYTDRGHICSGRFSLLLDIAHYNYGHGWQPHNRLVCFEFRDVQDFCLDLHDHASHEWDIYEIHINSVTRPIVGTSDASEDALELLLTRSFFVRESKWEQRQQSLFSFKYAIVEEKLST